jgi:adenylate kinase family enzyme
MVSLRAPQTWLHKRAERFDVERVMIIGTGGAGKSTLARKLGEATGLPVIHLDREHWLPGWVEPPRDDWAAKVAELAARDRWVMDGNYGGTMAARLERADTVVFMDFPRLLCIYRALKRTVAYRNQQRPDMTPGCNEKVDFKFLKWIWDYNRTRRPGILKLLAEAENDGKGVVILRHPKDAERWLETVRAIEADASTASA